MPIDYDRQHDWYTERQIVWIYNLDHEKGGRKLAEDGPEYLPQFAAEGDKGYQARLKRARGLYNHLVKRAVGVYQAQIFREDAERKLPSALETLVDDVDRHRTKAFEFFKRIYKRAQVTGQQYILIDAPAVTEGLSQADAQLRRLRPYFEHIPESNLIDWAVEEEDPARIGMLNYAVIKDELVIASAPFEEPERMTRYRSWTRTDWAIYVRSGQNQPGMVSSGAHRLGEVPIVPIYDQCIGPMKGETITDDVALSANALWNASSAADEAFWWQSFNILLIKTKADTLSQLDIGASRALKLGPEEDASYLTPSAVPFDAYDRKLAEIVERVTDLVFNRTSRQQPTGQVESAEKRKTDREEFVALLESKSNEVQRAETECWVFAAKWLGMSDEAARAAVNVNYPQEFDVNDTTIDDWQRLTENFIRSRIDWVRNENPELSEAQAKEVLMKNMALEEELKPALPTQFYGIVPGAQPGGTVPGQKAGPGTGATGDGNIPPERGTPQPKLPPTQRKPNGNQPTVQ